MNIFNNKKLYLFIAIFISILLFGSVSYFFYIIEQKEEMKSLNYEKQSKSMQSRLAQMIYEKQKATIAIGLVLAEDKTLIQELKSKSVNEHFYSELVERFRKETEYKNVWVNIVDRNFNSLYRSWTNKKGHNLKKDRPDIVKALQSKQVVFSIDADRYTVAIKVLIPVMENGEVLGILELISHFNSIALTLEKFDIESVVILNKEYTNNIQYPFTEKFLEGHYIANFKAPQDKLDYLQQNGIENYFSPGYKVEDGYIIVSLPLKSYEQKVVGYYIMFKSLSTVSSADEDFFLFKWIAIGFIVILIAAGVINSALFYMLSQQKSYITKIIDSSTNIVMIKDKKQILHVNKAFFKYFTDEKSAAEFREKYRCICKLFSEEEGYVHEYMGTELWTDYAVNNPDKVNKVKIIYGEKVYYFTLGVSLIFPDKGIYSVILTDITNEEAYKVELEKMTITDALTNVGNRRYYNIKIAENISMASRYKFPLSVVMIDIDYFKKVNDKYGHGVGDNVLIEYSKLITTMIRDADVICRLGGEEFIIIVPYADLHKAEKLAEKIRKSVEAHKVILPITMSFGVTEYVIGEDADHLLIRADEALYEAKENGRNQVVCK